MKQQSTDLSKKGGFHYETGKKLAAAVTAMAMAVGMMSIGASAYSQSYNLHYDYNDHYTNVTSQQWNKTVNSLLQSISVDSFSRYYYSQASVTVYNSSDTNVLTGTYTSAPNSLSKQFPATTYNIEHFLGSTITIKANLNNASTGTYANSTGSFSG